MQRPSNSFHNLKKPYKFILFVSSKPDESMWKYIIMEIKRYIVILKKYQILQLLMLKIGRVMYQVIVSHAMGNSLETFLLVWHYMENVYDICNRVLISKWPWLQECTGKFKAIMVVTCVDDRRMQCFPLHMIWCKKLQCKDWCWISWRLREHSQCQKSVTRPKSIKIVKSCWNKTYSIKQITNRV